jgi:hypothetical protein
MQSITETIMMLEKPKVNEHTHLAGILTQLRTVGYTHVKYLDYSYVLFSGPHIQELKVELPRTISANLPAIIGRGERDIDELLESKYFKIGDAVYKENIKQNHENGYLIQHKPNVLNARISKNGGEYIATLNGVIKTNPGDWIITGVNGEQYPCDPEIFKELYDVVEQEV